MQDFVHQPYHITSGLAVRLGAVPGGHGLQDENGTSHILSYWRGPYKGAKWFRVLQEEAMDFAKTLACADNGAGQVLLNAIAPRVAREMWLQRLRGIVQTCCRMSS